MGKKFMPNRKQLQREGVPRPSQKALLALAASLARGLELHPEWGPQPFVAMPFPAPPVTDVKRHQAFNTILNAGQVWSEKTQELAAKEYPDLARMIAGHKVKQRIQAGWSSRVLDFLNDVQRYVTRKGSSDDLHQLESRVLWRRCGDGHGADISRENCLADLESMHRLLSPVRRHSDRPKISTQLTIGSVLLLIARKAHGHQQKDAPSEIGIPQAQCSRLEKGSRAWTTKDLSKCLPYILSAPKEKIAGAFFDLVRREFPST